MLAIGLLALAGFFFFLWVAENVHAARKEYKNYRKVATSARKMNFRDPRY